MHTAALCDCSLAGFECPSLLRIILEIQNSTIHILFIFPFGQLLLCLQETAARTEKKSDPVSFSSTARPWCHHILHCMDILSSDCVHTGLEIVLSLLTVVFVQKKESRTPFIPALTYTPILIQVLNRLSAQWQPLWVCTLDESLFLGACVESLCDVFECARWQPTGAQLLYRSLQS